MFAAVVASAVKDDTDEEDGEVQATPDWVAQC